jgi:hypothetical protein
MLGKGQWLILVHSDSWLFWLMAVSDQSTENIDKAVDWRAVSRVFYLGNVLQRGFDRNAKILVKGHQPIFGRRLIEQSALNGHESRWQYLWPQLLAEVLGDRLAPIMVQQVPALVKGMACKELIAAATCDGERI